MAELYKSVVSSMSGTLAQLERRVPAPQVVEMHGRKNYRYKEESVH